jgi:hypothetical protein
MADGDDRLAHGDPLQPALAEIPRAEPDQQGNGHRSRQQRLGERRAPGLLVEQHQDALVQAHALVRLGRQQPRHSELGERLPQLG